MFSNYKAALDTKPRKHNSSKQNKGVSKVNKGPVFTQEMKDNGELPPAGSLLFYNGIERCAFKCGMHLQNDVYCIDEGAVSVVDAGDCHPLGSKEHAKWIEGILKKEGGLRPVWDDHIPSIEKNMVVASGGELFVIAEKPEKGSSMAEVYDKNNELCAINLCSSEPPSAEFLHGWRERQKNSTPKNSEAETRGVLTITPSSEGVALSIGEVKAKLSSNAGEAVMALHHLLKDELEAKRIAGLCDALCVDKSTVDLTNLLGS